MRTRARANGTVGEVVASLGEDPRSAIAEGRVFVGRTRARSTSDRVRAGDEIEVHAARASVALPDPFVLHHEDGVLMVDKPAGMPTIPDQAGAAHSLLHAAARLLKLDPTRLHPTSRLDRDVSGVVTFATTDAAREALRESRELGRYDRLYVAIALGVPTFTSECWDAPLVPDRPPRVHRVAPPGATKALSAVSRAIAVRTVGRFTLLALAPVTGRTHQLRVHAAAAGLPLVGDRAYGGPTRLTAPSGAVRAPGRIALHCARVDIGGPQIHRSSSPIPRDLAELAAFVGLDVEEALACAP